MKQVTKFIQTDLPPILTAGISTLDIHKLRSALAESKTTQMSGGCAGKIIERVESGKRSVDTLDVKGVFNAIKDVPRPEYAEPYDDVTSVKSNRESE